MDVLLDAGILIQWRNLPLLNRFGELNKNRSCFFEKL